MRDRPLPDTSDLYANLVTWPTPATPPLEVPFCEICTQDQTAEPGMVLGTHRGITICTDCLRDNPHEAEYCEQLALWCERFLPITRCQHCQCLTQTRQDPQGPDGGCRACLLARETAWTRHLQALRADDRSTLARLGAEVRSRTLPLALAEGWERAQERG
jgi:hypothetical protein